MTSVTSVMRMSEKKYEPHIFTLVAGKPDTPKDYTEIIPVVVK